MKIFSYLYRHWYWPALALVLLLLLGLAAPTLLGSRWIYEPLLARLRADDFQLEVDSMRLRWFTPIVIRGVRVQQDSGPVLLSIDEIRSNRGLLGYLLGGRQLGTITIEKPVVDIQLLSDSTNLTKLIKAIEGKKKDSSDEQDAESSKSNKPKLPSIDIELLVHGLSGTVHRPGETDPIVIIPPWDLHCSYRSVEGTSRIVVEPTEVLKEVELTPELIKLGLGLAVPLLAESAWFDGRVSFGIEAFEVPLDKPILTSGNATLTLHRVRCGPSDPSMLQLLDLMAHLRDREPHHELVFVDGSQIGIQVAEGRVYHEGIRAGLPKVDDRLQISTSGYVGMEDKSLDLTLNFPVPLALLAKKQEVRDVGIPTVRIPIVGTLDAPIVQWNTLLEDSGDLLGVLGEKIKEDSPGAAAILGALEKVADGEAEQAITFTTDLIRELRERRQKKLRQDNDPNSVADPNGENRRPVRDAIRDLFRGK